MDLVARMNVLLWTWIQSLRSFKRISIFFPFLLFAILQMVVVAILLIFYRSPFCHLLVPLMVRFFGEPSLHFPQHYIILPQIFNGANRWVLNPLISWWIIGSATLMFGSAYSGQRPKMGPSMGTALRRWWPLFVVGVVEFTVLIAVIWLFKLSATQLSGWGVQSPRLFSVVAYLINIALITPFAFTSASVVLGKQGVGGALKRSFFWARKNFGVIYFIFVIPSILTFMMSILLSQAPLIVARLNPTMVVLLILVSIGVTLLVNFVIVGALTALYLSLSKDFS